MASKKDNARMEEAVEMVLAEQGWMDPEQIIEIREGMSEYEAKLLAQIAKLEAVLTKNGIAI